MYEEPYPWLACLLRKYPAQVQLVEVRRIVVTFVETNENVRAAIAAS